MLRHIVRKKIPLTNLWIGSQLQQAFLSVEIPQLAGPRPYGPDVQAQGLLMGGRGQREGVVLVRAQPKACYADPLARTVGKALRPLELQMGHTCREGRGEFEPKLF